MSRSMLIVMVAFASYAVSNVLLSVIVAAMWRLKFRNNSLPPAERARQLIWLRSLPPAGAAFITLGVVTPAFAIFEPTGLTETAGPLALGLALVGIGQLIGAAVIAARTAIHTHVAARGWLQSSTPFDVDLPADVPAFIIDAGAPIVALVGVFRPKLVAARSVIAACNTNELTAIVAHERGHLHARDNLKRWLMACAPDALRWTSYHDEIAAMWHDAAENAADDAATGGDAESRTELASLILKIARLMPEAAGPATAVSPFVQQDGLDRRVRRLLSVEATEPSREGWLPLATLLAAAGIIAAAANPASMAGIYEFVESVIAFGR